MNKKELLKYFSEDEINEVLNGFEKRYNSVWK